MARQDALKLWWNHPKLIRLKFTKTTLRQSYTLIGLKWYLIRMK